MVRQMGTDKLGNMNFPISSSVWQVHVEATRHEEIHNSILNANLMEWLDFGAMRKNRYGLKEDIGWYSASQQTQRVSVPVIITI